MATTLLLPNNVMAPVPVVLILPDRRTEPVEYPMVISPPAAPVTLEVPEVATLPLKVISPELEITVTESTPLMLPVRWIGPFAEEMYTSARLEKGPETVIASENTIGATPAEVTKTPSPFVIPTAVTALAKVMDVAKFLTSTPAAMTLPDARKAPPPITVKFPKLELAEPTLPAKVTLPNFELRVRSLPAAEASTFPVMLISAVPSTVIPAVALPISDVVTKLPLTRAFAPL